MCCEYIASVKASWCTLSIQSLKADTRVKTVGFFTVLQPKPETKLAIPCTSQTPAEFLQFRGPPESPWGMITKKLLVVDTHKSVFKNIFYTTIQYLNWHNIPRPFLVTAFCRLNGLANRQVIIFYTSKSLSMFKNTDLFRSKQYADAFFCGLL